MKMSINGSCRVLWNNITISLSMTVVELNE